MMFNMRFFLIVSALFVFAAPGSAKAEIIFYKAADTKVSLTIPDTWARTANQQPDDVMTVLAPTDTDFAGCRMRVREDRRFAVYPRQYAGEVQRENFNVDFWENYIGEYDDAVLHSVTDNGSLGRGWAGYAEATYATSAGPRVQKHAMMYVSNYNGNNYIFECSAAQSAFLKWEQFFSSILKSVDFRKEIHEFPTGHYRNFLKDGPLRINGPRLLDTSYY